MAVVRTIQEVAERTFIDIKERQVAMADDPKATIQAIASSIGACLSAEREYIGEFIEDLPVMEDLPEMMEPQELCNLIVDKLSARNMLPTILVDERIGELPLQEIFTPRLVLTVDPVSMTYDDMILGSDDDLPVPFDRLKDCPIGEHLQVADAQRLTDGCRALIETGEPQVVFIDASVGRSVRNYMCRLQWNSRRTRIVISSCFKQVERVSDGESQVVIRLAEAI